MLQIIIVIIIIIINHGKNSYLISTDSAYVKSDITSDSISFRICGYFTCLSPVVALAITMKPEAQYRFCVAAMLFHILHAHAQMHTHTHTKDCNKVCMFFKDLLLYTFQDAALCILTS